MKFILGTKQYMTQIFDEKGNVHPATVITAGPIFVTQVKKKEKDGYCAVQCAFGDKPERLMRKAQKGHVKVAAEKVGVTVSPRFMREFRCTEADGAKFNVGDAIKVDAFAEGDKVEIAGISKSKGFQGVVKRHGFHGGPRSHGQKHSERSPGSIGAAGVQRVFKGMRMAGRMGGERITTKGLRILKANLETNELFIKGAVPGRRGTLLEIRSL